MKPTIIIYTHTDYSDVWPLMFGQMHNFLLEYKKIIFVNSYHKNIPNEYTQIFYDETLQYTDRVKNCLEQLSNEVILYLHEDMPLYDKPNHQLIEVFGELIKTNQADFIRLIKNSEDNSFYKSKLHTNLVKSSKNNLFAIQPTITTVEKLKKICSKVPNTNIWNFEIKVSQVCIENNLNKCFMTFFENEPKRGLYHWDSFCFPYIATAIVKGKWNFLEYSKELSILLEKYNINKNIRGVF